MKHGSLFSGIGGFDLAAEWMGWDNVFHCEWEPFPRQVLHHYWPNAISYEDIRQTDFTIHRGQIDILTGGFPCQPYSQAGKRLGKEDDRHLFPEMLRAIREIQPQWVVGENVLGLANWNGGLVFEEVQADLEAEGYEVQPYVLPAAGVNAPHQRYRIWFVAHSVNDRHKARRKKEGKKDRIQEISRQEVVAWQLDGTNISRQNWSTSDTQSEQSKQLRPEQRKFSEEEQGEFGRGHCKTNSKRPTSDTSCERLQRKETDGKLEWRQRSLQCVTHKDKLSYWEGFPTQSPICSRNDGFPGKLDGITFPKWRSESIKAYGNAVVPQLVLQIFKAIQQYENQYG